MACSPQGSSLILTLADAAVAAFGAITPVLSAGGKLSTAQATAITGYVTGATTTLETVISELKSGTSLVKIAQVTQTIVTEFDSLSGVLPPGLFLWVNVANVGVQALLSAIQAEVGPATTSAGVSPAVTGVLQAHQASFSATAEPPAAPETIKLSWLQGMHVGRIAGTLAGIQKSVSEAAASAAA